MSEFAVAFGAVRSVSEGYAGRKAQLAEAALEALRIKQGLTFEVRQRERIDARFNSLSSRLMEDSRTAGRFGQTLREAVSLYQAAEKQLLEGASSVPLLEQILSQTGAEGPMGQKIQDIWSFIRDMLDQPGKTFSDFLKSLENIPVVGSIASYYNRLVEFFGGDMTGLTGALALAGFGQSSIALWTEGYDLAKNYYHATDGIFNLKGQRAAGYIGLAGSGMGLVAAAVQAAGTRGKSAGEVVSGYLQMGQASVPFIRDAYQLEHLKDVKSLANGGGLISPAAAYSAVAESAFATVGQAAESISEYSADGEWDLGDTGATLIDSSIDGLYTMANSLTGGVLDAVGDQINFWMGGEPLAPGESYGDRIADAVKDTAEEIGKAIGNGINQAVDFFTGLFR